MGKQESEIFSITKHILVSFIFATNSDQSPHGMMLPHFSIQVVCFS